MNSSNHVCVPQRRHFESDEYLCPMTSFKLIQKTSKGQGRRLSVLLFNTENSSTTIMGCLSEKHRELSFQGVFQMKQFVDTEMQR